MTRSVLRFTLAALLIAAAAIFLQARGRNEVFHARVPLESFPRQLGPWTGTDVPIGKDVLEVLGNGEFLQRAYRDPHDPQPDIGILIAYFRSQRAGEVPHSPRNCYPGAGWMPVEHTRIPLSFPGHESFPANRYVFSLSDARQFVLYWYWAHDRGVASEYLSRFYLVADSIRMNRSDGSLIRIKTDMYPGETADHAEQRVLPFVNLVLPQLNTYIPR